MRAKWHKDNISGSENILKVLTELDNCGVEPDKIKIIKIDQRYLIFYHSILKLDLNPNKL